MPMKRLLAMLLTLALSACAPALAEAGLTEIRCPEQGFSTRCNVDFGTQFVEGDGLYVYTEYYDSIPYVLIFRSESRGLDLRRYFSEEFTPYMQASYGDDLVGVTEYGSYEVAGREMVGADYTYRLNGYVIHFLRVADFWDGCPVFFGAKYVQGDDAATLAALEALVANFRTDAGGDAVPAPQSGGEARQPASAQDMGDYRVTAREAIVSGTAKYDDGRFSVTLPEGWQVRTTGEFMTFGFRASDPAAPERSLFLFMKLEPFLKSRAAKQFYRKYNYAPTCDAPVMEAPTLDAFLAAEPEVIDFCQAYYASGLSLDPAVFPELYGVRVQEKWNSSIPCPSTCRDNAVARIAFTTQAGAPCEGLVTAQPTDMGSYIAEGIDTWFYTAYLFMGVTAPQGELAELEPVLTQCLASFDFAPQYVKTALDVSEQEKNALLSVASSMQAAMDSYNDAWSARQTSYDISAQKASDAILGYDRLYDPDTGETYRAELGFYDSYDLNRSGFANPNLQRVDDGAEQYYLSGVDYYITK